MMEVETEMIYWDDERRSEGVKKEGGLQKPENAKNSIYPQDLQKKNTVLPIPCKDSFQTSDPQNVRK